MNSRNPLPTPSGLPDHPAGVPMTASSPIGQRLAFALESRLRRRRGRLDRLELALVHTVAAGTGWTTDWRVRARVEDHRGSAAIASAAPAPGLRTIDCGALPPGQALDQLWRWALETSTLHRLPGPALSERIVFSDAATEATAEVIRHRVLRSAAVLDRLPVSLEVKLGRRRDTGGDAAQPTSDHTVPPNGHTGHAPVPQYATQPVPVPAPVPFARLIARFPPREGTHGETRVVVWDAERNPGLVALLRHCARHLDPRSASHGLPSGLLP